MSTSLRRIASQDKVNNTGRIDSMVPTEVGGMRQVAYTIHSPFSDPKRGQETAGKSEETQLFCNAVQTQPELGMKGSHVQPGT